MTLRPYQEEARKAVWAQWDEKGVKNTLLVLVTGGSDYHCDDNRHGQPGSTCLRWTEAEKDVAALLWAMENMQH